MIADTHSYIPEGSTISKKRIDVDVVIYMDKCITSFSLACVLWKNISTSQQSSLFLHVSCAEEISHNDIMEQIKGKKTIVCDILMDEKQRKLLSLLCESVHTMSIKKFDGSEGNDTGHSLLEYWKDLNGATKIPSIIELVHGKTLGNGENIYYGNDLSLHSMDTWTIGNVSDDSQKNVEFMIHIIDGNSYVFAYISHTFNDFYVSERLMKTHKFVSAIIARSRVMRINKTLFYIYGTDNRMKKSLEALATLEPNTVPVIHTNGDVRHLPFEKIVDEKVFGLMDDKFKRYVFFETKKISYVLFETEYVHVSDASFSILKSYFNDCDFIVYNSSSTKNRVFDSRTLEMKKLNAYTIFFNEKSLESKSRLVHEVLRTYDHAMTFETELDIYDIFIKMFLVPDDEITELCEESSGEEDCEW